MNLTVIAVDNVKATTASPIEGLGVPSAKVGGAQDETGWLALEFRQLKLADRASLDPVAQSLELSSALGRRNASRIFHAVERVGADGAGISTSSFIIENSTTIRSYSNLSKAPRVSVMRLFPSL